MSWLLVFDALRNTWRFVPSRFATSIRVFVLPQSAQYIFLWDIMKCALVYPVVRVGGVDVEC